MTVLKNSRESFKSRADHEGKKGSMTYNTEYWKLSSQRKKERKRVKKAYGIYETQQKGKVSVTWKFQEKRKGQKVQ